MSAKVIFVGPNYRILSHKLTSHVPSVRLQNLKFDCKPKSQTNSCHLSLMTVGGTHGLEHPVPLNFAACLVDEFCLNRRVMAWIWSKRLELLRTKSEAESQLEIAGTGREGEGLGKRRLGGRPGLRLTFLRAVRSGRGPALPSLPQDC